VYLPARQTIHLGFIWECIHSKNAGLFRPKFGSNVDKPKCCVKNVISF